MRRAAGAVAYDDRVRAHRLERQRGVLAGLALGQAGALGGEVDDVRAEPLGRGLEGDPGAGGVLEEQVDHGAAAQRRQLLDRPVGELAQLGRGGEDQLGVVAEQVARAQQVALHGATCSP